VTFSGFEKKSLSPPSHGKEYGPRPGAEIRHHLRARGSENQIWRTKLIVIEGHDNLGSSQVQDVAVATCVGLGGFLERLRYAGGSIR